MTTTKRYPIVALERISFKLHSRDATIDKKVGHILPDVIIKNESNPDDLSTRRSNSGIKDTITCQVKEEIVVATVQANALPKREYPSIVSDLVVKIKKESEELIDFYDDGDRLVCAKKSLLKVKHENQCEVSVDGSHFNNSSANSSDEQFSTFSTVRVDGRILSKASETFLKRSQTQQRNNSNSCNMKLFNVSVKLQDLFPSYVRKLGKAHSNGGLCPCIYCRGEYRFSNHLGALPKNHKNQTGSIGSQYLSLNMENQSECGEHSYLNMTQSVCSNSRVVAVTLDKYPAESQSSCKPNKPKRSGRGRTVFSCRECSVKVAGRSHFKDHLRVHSGERPFKCKLCPAKFAQRGTLKGHHIRVHSNVRSFQCKQCPAKFVTSKELMYHSWVHTGEKSFECPQCYVKFVQRSSMQTHMKRVHSDVRPFKCVQCPGAFKLRRDLEIHMRVHTGEKPFKCELCPARFSQGANLRTHATVHSMEKAFICAHCPSKFRLKDALRCHLRTHSAERPFSCGECTLKFKSKYELKRHLLGSHATERPFKCKQCPAEFKRQSTLWTHSRYVHSDLKPFKCKQCPLRFKLNSTLRTHLKRHSNVKPFKCDQCRTAFKSKYDLAVHVRIHTGERPFKCHQCPASFVQSGQLRKHTMLHIGDRPFKCEQCSANFSQSGHLKMHLKKMHSCKL